MRAANAGDAAAYEAFLRAVLPSLRAFARHATAATRPPIEAEDIVQETLIAIHTKRQTWIDSEPIGPWIRAIARHKMIDALRRRGHRLHLSVEAFADVLPAEPAVLDDPRRDLARHLDKLPARQRGVLQAIAIDGQSIRQTAARLTISEGAVRVALHRGVVALAAILKQGNP